MKRMSIAALLLLCVAFSQGCCCSPRPCLFSSLYDPCGSCGQRQKSCCGQSDFSLPPAPSSSCGCGGTAGVDMTGMTGEVYSQMQTAPGMNAGPQFTGAALPPPLPSMNTSPTIPASMGTEFASPPPMLQTMSGQLAPISYSVPQANCPTCNQHNH